MATQVISSALSKNHNWSVDNALTVSKIVKEFWEQN